MIQLKHVGSLHSLAATLKKEKEILYTDNIQLKVSILFPAVGWRLLCQAKLKDNCLINSSKCWQCLPTRAGMSFNDRGAVFCVYFSIDFLTLSVFFLTSEYFQYRRSISQCKTDELLTIQKMENGRRRKAGMKKQSACWRRRHVGHCITGHHLRSRFSSAFIRSKRETFLWCCSRIETSEETIMERKSLVFWA